MLKYLNKTKKNDIIFIICHIIGFLNAEYTLKNIFDDRLKKPNKLLYTLIIEYIFTQLNRISLYIKSFICASG